MITAASKPPALHEIAETNLVREVFRTALSQKGKRALGIRRINAYRWYTYDDTFRVALGICQGLRELGVEAGDRVAILSKNRPEWVLADLGILSLGAASVPLYDTLTHRSVQFLLQDSQAKGIFLSNDQQLRKLLPHLGDLPDLRFIVTFDKVLATETGQAKLYQFGQLAQRGRANLTESAFLDSLHEISPDQLATIIYTSGTTSLPKGARLTHGNILHNVRCVQQLMPVEPTDRALSYLPLAHVMERTSHFAYLVEGLTVVHSRGQDRLMDELQDVKPSFLVGVPRFFEKTHASFTKRLESSFPFIRHVIKASLDWRQNPPRIDGYRNDGLLRTLGVSAVNDAVDRVALDDFRRVFGGRLKFFISGGAPLDREVAEFFGSLGIPILEGYGLTETAPIVSINTLEERKYGTVGKPLPGVEVRIAEHGEVLVRGPNVMLGYHNREQENAEAFTEDGWFRTGDIGFLDAEGFLVLTDRLKNIIVLSTGKNVSPAPIEDTYRQSPYIQEIVVVGDNQKFITALILCAPDALRSWAAQNSIIYRDATSLVKRQEVHHLIEGELRQYGEDLAPYERVKKFILLDEEFTQPGGTLTPTLKVKRDYLVQKCQNEIAMLYLSGKNVADIYF